MKMKAIEDENLSTTDTKPTPSKSSKSASKTSSKKKAKVGKHRKPRRHSKPTAQASKQPQPSPAAGTVATKKTKSSKDADAVSSNSLCLGIGFFVQFLIGVGALAGWLFSYLYNMDKTIQFAFLILLVAQIELLVVLFLANFFKALAWATIINHVVFCLVENGYAIYVTITDIPLDCHKDGCSCLHGTLVHRVVFLVACVVFGGIHAFLSCLISIDVCLSTTGKNDANVEAQKHLPNDKVAAVEPALPRKTRWISESETQSRSSAKSRKRRSARRVSLSVSSWNSLPTKSSDATSFLPTDSSQKVTSATSSDYPYVPQAVSTASSCPLSAALVAQSKQPRPAFSPPPCPTPNPFIYFYGSGQRQQPPAVDARNDVTVNVTYPSTTSVGGTREYSNVTVRIPAAHPQQGYPQQQQLPAPLQPQVSVGRHRRRTAMEYYPYAEPYNQPPLKAQSVKTAKGFGNGGSEASSFNVSQTSEANSMVLPSSFASQDDRGNAGQRIFTANTPSSKHY